MILYSLTKAVMRVFYGIFMPAKFVYGKENLNPNETVIYCANHRHAYDPLLLAARFTSWRKRSCLKSPLCAGH